jgi:ABC-type Fe3+-hydroxamate transport system substrate-binding protein
VRRLRPLLCVAAALVVGGCQATDTDDPPETSHNLKVQHALGETKVPGHAERPVTLYPSELDDSFALGAAPVGAAGVLPRYLRRRTHDVRLVGPIARPQISRIAALDPDLILAAKQSQKRLYDRLEEIAPTVVMDQKVDWKPNLRQDGEALGEADFAEKLLTDYDGRAARVRELIRSRGTPTLPAAVRGSLTRPFVASILDDVGVDHPKPRTDLPAGARPGPYDAWTLGVGYIAATRILADLERFTRS